jgi:hypothetical protein
MSARRTLALLLVCLTVPALVACSDDPDEGSKASTTTAAPDNASGSTEAPPTTSEQLPFAEGVAQMNQNLEAATGDVCALVASLGTVNVADPTNPDEAKQAVDVVVKYLDAIADAAPDEAAPLHKAADDFQAEAEAANYDVAALSESQVMSSGEVSTALSTATEKCTAPTG